MADSNFSETSDQRSLLNQLAEAKQEAQQWKQAAATNRQLKQDNTSISVDGLDIFLLRIDQQNQIRYVNKAFATYLGLTKEDLVNQNVSLLNKFISYELVEVIAQIPEEPVIEINELRDERNARILRLKINTTAQGRDIILQDVTSSAIFKHYAQRYLPIDIEALSPEDLDTFYYPERRFMSVFFIDLRGFTSISEVMPPEAVRSLINNYCEEVISAVEANSGTIDKIIGDEVMALFGAPIYHSNHAFRAIKTAADTLYYLRRLQSTYAELGQCLPESGIGINTGDMVVGNIGTTRRQNYTVLGSSVNLASRLCDAAQGDEILITQTTFDDAILQLPEEWQVNEVEIVEPYDFTRIKEHIGNIADLPADLAQKGVVVGPNVLENPENYEFCFRFLCTVKSGETETPTALLSVIALDQISEATLNEIITVNTNSSKIFGKYKLLHRLNRGSSGEVWKAEDQFGNIVAIKMLMGREAITQHQRLRFKREAESMARLIHRGICKIYEVGEFDHTPYISMEFIDGVSLAQLIELEIGSKPESYFNNEKLELASLIESSDVTVENSSSTNASSLTTQQPKKSYRIIPRRHSLDLISGIAGALQYAHGHGVLHRDLKPSNIMLRKDGEPIITDFGLAKLTTAEHDVSISGEIVGTVDFMAPEQARSSKDVSVQADIFSLGSIFYLLITGRKHFHSSGNILTDIQKLQEHIPTPPSRMNSDVDEDLDIITMKTLQNDDNKRYFSMSGLRNDIEHYQKGEPIEAKATTIGEIIWKLILRNKSVFSVMVASIVIITTLVTTAFVLVNNERIQAIQAKNDSEQALAQLTIANQAIEKAEQESLELLQKLIDQEKATQNAEELYDQANKILAERYLRNASKKFKNEELEEAIKPAQKATIYAPEVPATWLALAKYHEKLGNYDQAINTLKEGMKQTGTEKPFQETLADITKAQKKANDRRYKVLNTLANNQPASQKEAIETGNSFATEGKLKEAAIAYESALKAPHPFLPQIRIQLFHVQAKAMNSAYEESHTDFTIDGKRITSISINQAPLEQLPPLSDLELDQLVLNEVPLEKINTLLPLTTKGLDLINCPFTDLAPISRIEGLIRLTIKDSQVVDLSPLENLKIHTLNLNNCNKIDDISPLLKMPQLIHLDLSETQITDFSLIREMKLTSLSLANTTFSETHLLTGLSIKNLNLDYTLTRDLKPLSYNIIEKLHLTGTLIDNLNAIKNMPLKKLYIGKTDIISLEDINIKNLEELGILETNVTDLTPLSGAPLKSISLTPHRIEKGMPTLRGIKTLDKIHANDETLKPEIFWKRYDEDDSFIPLDR
ncbi:MAG: protein kinase [Verrucomicrobiota bacterium]